ncbi:acyl-CoA synthetase [Sphingobium sp. UBA5915]|uniref:acyl-CoA synthetase n=1 Tax=Sphingobium sp. UBA5915 TaxID=1947530 RepID=UPI0025F7A1D3|nr:acyl-CoA synthetase [Sphingobium sp. UBA5915]
MTGVATIDDVRAIEAQGLPANWPESTYDLLRRGAAIDPDAPALSFFLTAQDHARPECWTYRRLMEQVHRTANAFHALSATPDTVIAFLLPNLPETHFVLWGGEAAGIVAAINPLLEPDAIADILNAAGASILVSLAPFPKVDFWDKVRTIAPKVPSLRHLVLVNLADRVHGLKGIGARLLQRRSIRQACGPGGLRGVVPAHVQVHDFRTLTQRQPADRLVSGRHISASDPSSFFCTGGTTGAPKIAMRRHGAETANAWAIAQFMGSGFGRSKTVFCGLPLFHVNGVMVTGLVPFSQGAHVVLGTPQGYRGEGVVQRFWDIVAHHRINFFSGVPTLYAALMAIPVEGRNIDCLEYGLCGAAPMPVQLMKDFEAQTGLRILEGYGLTEATCVSSVNPPNGERRAGSIGLSLPGQPMKAVILDEAGAYVRDCLVNEVGVMVVSGPNLFDGYRLDDQNAGLWIDAGEGRIWLNTGDLGREDGEGYFWLTGRKKELIIRGGHNIDPAAIEEPLHRHPAVQFAAAIGRPDPHVGELPVAYVQLKPGTAISESQLLQFAQQQITERAAAPKDIHIIDEMPLTPVGKVFKPALKRHAIRKAALSVLLEAKLNVKDVDVVDDPRRGIIIQAAVTDARQIETAKRSLGRLPFHHEVRLGS